MGTNHPPTRAPSPSWECGPAVGTSPEPVFLGVRRRARRQPDAAAVIEGTAITSYRELVAEADKCAAMLRRLGVTRGSVVPVLLPRGAMLYSAMVGVNLAGAAYLVLSPEDPVEYRQALLDAVGATVMIAEPGGSNASVLVVSADQWSGEDDPVSPVDVCPDDPCYVSFTSGSTGTPKGVLVPHRAVARLVTDPSWLTLTSHDRVLQLAPGAFDASTLEIWGPLARGAAIAPYRPGPLDLSELASHLDTAGVTVAWMTAGLLGEFLRQQPDPVPSVRVLLSGGDVIPARTVTQAATVFPHATFVNGYGPTENTTFTTTWQCPREWHGEEVPIGRPVDGTDVYILDENLRRVAVGEVGELYTSGSGLAHGYLDQPGETAARFVADPFGRGTRMYRTGDLAVWTAEGDILFRGRVDRQVKVMGYRVEVAAVERAVAATPGVDECVVVVVHDDDSGARTLSAYVTAHSDVGDPDAIPGAVRDRLRQSLPAHWIPRTVTLRDAWPLTTSGKIDHSRLLQCGARPRAATNDYIAPSTTDQRAIVTLWAEILGLETVGITDDFFDIGGHSLSAASFLERFEATFGHRLPARVLYLNPTVREICEHLETRSA